MGLLAHSDDDRFIAVSPMLAEATVLGAEDLELGAPRASVEQRRDAIRRLVPDWNAAFTSAPARASSTSSPIRPDRNVLMHYADRCQHELLSVAPGRLPTTRIDGRTRVANVYSARRGIKTARAVSARRAARPRHPRLSDRARGQRRARSGSPRPCPAAAWSSTATVALLPIPTERPGQARAGHRARPERDRVGGRDVRAAVGRVRTARGRHRRQQTTTPNSTRPGRRSCD